jgi:hypothetical protein
MTLIFAGILESSLSQQGKTEYDDNPYAAFASVRGIRSACTFILDPDSLRRVSSNLV